MTRKEMRDKLTSIQGEIGDILEILHARGMAQKERRMRAVLTLFISQAERILEDDRIEDDQSVGQKRCPKCHGVDLTLVALDGEALFCSNCATRL